MPILKNEIKCLPPLPPLNKSSTVLHTFNSTILTPVSNNNSGFLRNLLNSSTGKVCARFITCTPYAVEWIKWHESCVTVGAPWPPRDGLGHLDLPATSFFPGIHFLNPECLAWGLASLPGSSNLGSCRNSMGCVCIIQLEMGFFQQ